MKSRNSASGHRSPDLMEDKNSHKKRKKQKKRPSYAEGFLFLMITEGLVGWGGGGSRAGACE